MKAQLTLVILLVTTSLATAQKRTIDVGSFTKLSLGINANLYLTQGSDEKVTIDCSDSDFEKITFEQSGERLSIRRKEKWSWKGDGFRDVDIYVTMKDIERIALSGSGSVQGENKLRTDDLELAVSGSGEIELNLAGEDVAMKISGSGDITLEGTAEEMEARISGSGKVKAEDMSVKKFEASISGSGSCYIAVSEEVKANISGSGSVYYSGEPNKVIAKSSGSGKIRKM